MDFFILRIFKLFLLILSITVKFFSFVPRLAGWIKPKPKKVGDRLAGWMGAIFDGRGQSGWIYF